jgi:hypothetical protein
MTFLVGVPAGPSSPSPLGPAFSAAPATLASAGEADREKACTALIAEANGAINRLKIFMDKLTAGGRSLADALRIPGVRAEIGKLLDEAEVRIKAVLNQCKGVLSARQVGQARSLEGEIRDIRERLSRIDLARNASQAASAAADVAGRLAGAVGKGVEIIGGLLLWLLSLPFRQPGLN